MAKAKKREPGRRLTLSVRLTLLVLLAALLPLAAVVSFNTYQARKTLVTNGQNALTTDAKSKVALINTYLQEREADGQALASLPTTPAFLACTIATQLPPDQAAAINEQANCLDQVQGYAFYKGSNQRALAVGIVRDPRYTYWTLYGATGTPLLSHKANSSDTTPPSGSIPGEDLRQMQAGKSFISAVYFDSANNYAYVNVYTPVSFGGKVLGFLLARLKMDYIWSLVDGETNANGTGSAAFITDQNGIRIADSDHNGLFHAIQPLTADTQQLLAKENRYGSSAIPQDSLPVVASSLNAKDPTPGAADSFQSPAVPGSTVKYQYVRIHLDNVPWTFFVLSPLSTVTAVADSQVRTSLLAAGVIAILAVLLGLWFGTRTTRPVRSSTAEVEGAAAALKQLAARQQNSAGEQQWVVDACKTGLEGVRYLSDAMNQAARRIIDASNWFGEYWDRLTEEQAKRTVQHLLELARYIDEAARRQNASSERLGKAITVTMQVSDQLASGANAATASADQLEQVVRNLQYVVGGRSKALAVVDEMDAPADDYDMMLPQHSFEAPMEAPRSPFRGGRSSQLDGALASGQRQLPPASAPIAPDAWGRQSRASQNMQGSWNGNGSGRRPGDSQVYGGNGNGNGNGGGAGWPGGGFGNEF